MPRSNGVALGSLVGGVIALVLALAAGAAEPVAIPEACQVDCRAPYGIALGKTADGIVAYSNCNNRCVVVKPNLQGGVFTGIQWQCVEFARRWLLTETGMVYGSVDVAADIWDKVQNYTRVADGRAIPVVARLNGSAQAPVVGDLLIYGRELYGTGHVAVVTEVDVGRGLLRVAEQNYRNEPWSAHYAREIALVRHGDGYWVLDPHLIGWKHVDLGQP